MIDPLTQTMTALAASVSAVTMALLGVDHLSIIYGLVGALFAMFEAERMGRWRAIFYVVLSTVAGAAMGNSLAGLVTGDRFVLFVGCIVCGFGTHAILSRLLRRGLRIIDGKPPAVAAAGEDGGSKP